MNSNQQQAVVIVGGAAGSKIVFDIFSGDQRYNVIGFIDNYLNKSTEEVFELPDFGSVVDNERLLCEDGTEYFVATGDNFIRGERIRDLYQITGKKPINAVHKTATISEKATIGYGNLINTNAVINCDTKIGDGVIINTGANVDHDNKVDDYAQISPGCNLAGYVTVEQYGFIGTGVDIIPETTIRTKSKVGAGAVVTKNTKKNSLYVGVPAELKKEEIHDE